ncbi:MAG: hypothetical protein ACRCUK_03360, partial [Plesiomonas shigelloides]
IAQHLAMRANIFPSLSRHIAKASTLNQLARWQDLVCDPDQTIAYPVNQGTNYTPRPISIPV